MPYKNIGIRLQRRRKELGLSQEQVAERADISTIIFTMTQFYFFCCSFAYFKKVGWETSELYNSFVLWLSSAVLCSVWYRAVYS